MTGHPSPWPASQDVRQRVRANSQLVAWGSHLFLDPRAQPESCIAAAL